MSLQTLRRRFVYRPVVLGLSVGFVELTTAADFNTMNIGANQGNQSPQFNIG